MASARKVRIVRRETKSWVKAFDVLRSPPIGSVAALGLLLCDIFVLWLFAARATYPMAMGDQLPALIEDFVCRVFSTREGWRLALWATRSASSSRS